MRWVEDEQYVERRHVEETHAQRKIHPLLMEEALDDLTVDDFNRDVWRHGHLDCGDDQRDWSDVSVGELQARLDSGEWQVEGNRTVGQATNTWGIQLKVAEDEKPELLRSALRLLLYSEGDIHDRVEEVDADTNGLGRNAITLILCMMRTDELGIMNQKSESGLRKLAWLLGAEDEWEERIAGDYRVFNELLHEVRYNSGGVLRDMLMVDAFLYGLSELPEEPQHWKVALGIGGDDHEDLVREASERGFAAIGFSEKPDDLAVRNLKAIAPGDYAVMHVEGAIGGVGRVTRPYYETDSDDVDNVDYHWWRRIGVDWLLGEHKYGDLLPGAKQRLTVIDLEQDVFWRLAEKYADDPRYEEVLNPPDNWREIAGLGDDAGLEELLGDRLGPTLESAARTCCCEPAFIEEIVAQLRRKGQVILYGPPGPGKTYVARRIAEYLTEGDDSRRELIQFHPSYTYEDFMEGIKPESRQCADDRWEVSYPVRAGSFMRFCERARDDEDGDRKYVFIIDEINRGQIAKVFGELMYLLEYRDDDIQLAYTKSETDDSRQRFSIPRNVLIIGTMNTADRSIALVDFALRRRFTFIPFFPDDRADRGHVQGMLRRWLIREGKDQQAWVAEMLDALNQRLEPDVGRDFLIGHSYFMHEDLSEETVRETWRFQIEPLLREYFVGQQSRLDGYKLDELIASAQGVEQPEGDAESDEADVVAEEPGDDEP